MKIQTVNNTSFNQNIRILSKENKHIPFLYNDLLKISRDNKLATNFRTTEIEFPNVSDSIVRKIKRLGIKIAKANKKKTV